VVEELQRLKQQNSELIEKVKKLEHPRKGGLKKEH